MNGPHGSSQPGANTVLLTADDLRAQTNAIREELNNQIRPVLRPAGSKPTKQAWYRRFRPELYLLVSLLAAGAVYRLRGVPASQTTGGASTTVTTDTTGHGAAQTTGVVSYMAEQLATHTALARYIATNQLRTRLWVSAVSNSSAFGASAISTADRQVLGHIVIALNGNTNLTDDQVARVRGILYPYAYGTWASQQSPSRLPDDFKLAPPYSRYDKPLLKSLVQRMDLSDVVSSSPEPDDEKVATAIVMRLLQAYAPGASSL